VQKPACAQALRHSLHKDLLPQAETSGVNLVEVGKDLALKFSGNSRESGALLVIGELFKASNNFYSKLEHLVIFLRCRQLGITCSVGVEGTSAELRA